MSEFYAGREPGIISAEEGVDGSGRVSRPTYLGGPGFGFKWNMGGMHDPLLYFRGSRPSHYPPPHADVLAHGRVQRGTSFLPLFSHDEGSCRRKPVAELDKRPGDRFGRKRSCKPCAPRYAYICGRIRRKLLFHGRASSRSGEELKLRRLGCTGNLLGVRGAPGGQSLCA